MILFNPKLSMQSVTLLSLLQHLCVNVSSSVQLFYLLQLHCDHMPFHQGPSLFHKVVCSVADAVILQPN